MSAPSRHILVIGLSSTCGHCQVYKKTQKKKLEDLITKSASVEIKEIEVTAKNHSSVIAASHPDLANYIKWYPTFMVFTRSSWENKNGKLVGEVMGGKVIDGKASWDPSGGFEPGADSIYKWIQKTLNHSKFKQGPSRDKNKVVVITNKDRPIREPSHSGVYTGEVKYTHTEIDPTGY